MSSKRHLYTIVFQRRGLCDINLHRKEEVVKHQLRRRCLQQPTVTELIVFEDVARSKAMVNPELRRQSVEIVEVRIICSIPFDIGGIYIYVGSLHLICSSLVFI